MGTVQELLRFLNQLDRISTGGLTICSLLLHAVLANFPSITVSIDASKTGWEIKFSGVTTGGQSTEAELELHINCLEFKAALFTSKSFYEKLSNTCIQLLSDSPTTISCVNYQGSTKAKCNETTREIWLWCMYSRDLVVVYGEKGNWIVALHSPGTANVAADEEFRMDQRELECKLDSETFHKILFLLDVIDTVDLFASRVNNELARYVAWKPYPGAWKIDAFSVNWTDFSEYCFPPFCRIARILQRLNC